MAQLQLGFIWTKDLDSAELYKYKETEFIGVLCWGFMLGFYVGVLCWDFMLGLYVGVLCWGFMLGFYVGVLCWGLGCFNRV